MELQNILLKIIDRYLEQEFFMVSLYERFAKEYSDHEKFWASLVSEEYEHAAWIKHFQAGVVQDKIHFSELTSRIFALDSSIAYIKNRISEFDKQPFDIRKALSICLDVEKSLIERNVFKRFESDSLDVKQILDVLRQAQEEHIKKIENFIASL